MLKNYTSGIPVSKSVAYIEQLLARNGVKQIGKHYDGGRLIGIFFIIEVNGSDVPFKLPARVAECERVLTENLSRRARPETRKKIPQQAERTAWKILSDWIEAQMAMVELSRVELIEIFLPFVWDADSDKTFFEELKERSFKGLLPG